MRRIYVALFCLSTTLFAQVDRGTITGTITDPTGAIVAGATIRIVSESTNASQQAATSSAGTYGFFNLPIGLYNVAVEANGFRRAEMKGVRVEVNQQSKVDVILQVGELAQTVEVAALASLVQT
jgi:hypothetical protein